MDHQDGSEDKSIKTAPEPQERQRVAPAGHGGARVLVVDDDEVLRQLVCLALAEDGFEAAGAGDTATALQVVAASPPGVILLDLQLGVELGEDFVRRYQALPGPHAPIIVFTANGTHAAAAEMARLGTAGALGKPFDLEQLVTLVAELTGNPN
jgi:DNA-binding response OmpR family regulator